MSAPYRVAVLTCDLYIECVRPFAWLFNKYYSPDIQVVVGGFTPPTFELPSNFEFVSLGKGADFPPNRYSNGLIKFLRYLTDDVFMFMLEDQWLTAPVNLAEIQTCIDVARNTDNLLRIDVIDDRRYMNEFTFGKTDPYGTFDGVELIKSHWCPYQFAIYGTLFNRENLLRYIPPNLDPWQLENTVTNIIRWKDNEAIVLGTTRKLLQCANGLRQQTELYQQGKRGIGASAIEGGVVEEDKREMIALGIYDEARMMRGKQ